MRIDLPSTSAPCMSSSAFYADSGWAKIMKPNPRQLSVKRSVTTLLFGKTDSGTKGEKLEATLQTQKMTRAVHRGCNELAVDNISVLVQSSGEKVVGATPAQVSNDCVFERSAHTEGGNGNKVREWDNIDRSISAESINDTYKASFPQAPAGAPGPRPGVLHAPRRIRFQWARL